MPHLGEFACALTPQVPRLKCRDLSHYATSELDTNIQIRASIAI
jgi:hypothetical protein